MDKFFENNTFVIDEKIQTFKFENAFKVYNDNGDEIGAIKENMPTSRKFLSLFISKKLLPLQFDVLNAEGSVAATLKRGWTMFMSKIQIFDEKGTQVGLIKQKWALKPKFEIYDMKDNLIAVIKGDWVCWEFKIMDPKDNQIGLIDKKFNGLAKELFTDADKYAVTIEPSVTEPALRIAIASSASAIDMIYKENN